MGERIPENAGLRAMSEESVDRKKPRNIANEKRLTYPGR